MSQRRRHRRADPGGNFASDEHRRVLGHLPLPDADRTSVEDLLARLQQHDRPFTNFGRVEELTPILDELLADGHAACSKDGDWRMTRAGLDELCAPVPEP